jgi:hypothetical protein
VSRKRQNASLSILMPLNGSRQDKNDCTDVIHVIKPDCVSLSAVAANFERHAASLRGKRQKGREVDNLNIERHAWQPDKSLKRRGLCQDGYRQINKKIMTVRRIF